MGSNVQAVQVSSSDWFQLFRCFNCSDVSAAQMFQLLDDARSDDRSPAASSGGDRCVDLSASADERRLIAVSAANRDGFAGKSPLTIANHS